MISGQDIIKYIALLFIIYFLIKAFASDCLTNTQIIVLVVCIMVIVIFLISLQTKCPTNLRREHFQAAQTISEPGVTAPNNVLSQQYSVTNADQDIQDFKNIVGIDKQKYEQIVQNEQIVSDRIRSNFQDDMRFTTTNPLNTVPLGSQLYGYTFLPPENWFRAYETPPICVTNNRSPVYPSIDRSIVGLMEFDTTNNVNDRGILSKQNPKLVRANV